MSNRLWLAVAAALCAGCHTQPVPVPVRADPAALAELAGNWIGTYQGSESGRSGQITFQISEHGDSAFGDVLMVPQSGAMPHPVDPPAAHLRHASSPQSLSIAFVALAGDRVRGTLEPYVAPDCQCRVQTTFTGAVSGDQITGTFITRTANGAEQTGHWHVSRDRHP